MFKYYSSFFKMLGEQDSMQFVGKAIVNSRLCDFMGTSKDNHTYTTSSNPRW